MCTLITIASLFSLMQDGFTPLYAASQNGHEGVVELLVDKRANVDQQNKVLVLHSKRVDFYHITLSAVYI